ncbi:MAG TPA: hypothetical protein VHG52_08040 [Thermomicrobiales bacterium]|nr:hypothetical protein [Thermomicrobiales bacterium]
MRTLMRILTAQILTMGLVAAWVTPAAAAGPLTQRCTNSAEGFSVSYPSDWYTNEAGSTHGDLVDTCTLFAPFDDIEILPEAVNVPVFLKVESGPLPDGTTTTIDGRPGVIVEAPDLGGAPAYIYYARLSDDTRFAAFAFDNATAPFGESRAVLDAMVGTVDFDGAEPGEEEGEQVILELTLSGTVDTGDTFGIYRQCVDSPVCGFIHDLDIVCSGNEFGQELYSYPECAARTYRLSYSVPVGEVLEYGIVRWTGTLHGKEAQHLLRDSVRVPEGGITLRLGYDYSLGAQPAAPTTPPALPDTAAPSFGGGVAIGVLLVAMSLLLWRLPTTKRLGRN